MFTSRRIFTLLACATLAGAAFVAIFAFKVPEGVTDGLQSGAGF